jgi:hypothetical protein
MEIEMRKGSIPRSIELPAGSVECPSYAPDGLTEADIDALIAEVAGDDLPTRPRPGWLSTDEIETRRARRTARQTVRGLAAWVSSDRDGEVA